MSEDRDPLMAAIRRRLERIQEAKGFPTDYNHLTPAVHEHYRQLLDELVDEYFEHGLVTQ
jgi:hypothetical protein